MGGPGSANARQGLQFPSDLRSHQNYRTATSYESILLFNPILNMTRKETCQEETTIN